MSTNILMRNNVKVSGRGTQPILFAHGFGCDQHMWRFVAPAFEDEYRVIVFDYVGAGQSDWQAYRPERYETLNGYAQDVLEVCQALDLSDIIFVGHSVSSVIGLLASNQEPERFDRLVLVGPSACYINQPPEYVGGFERSDIKDLLELMERNDSGWASLMAPSIMKNPNRPELSAELEHSFCAMDPEIAHQFARATFLSDYRNELSKMQVPSLIMQCAEDIIAPLEVGLYLHAHLSHSELQLLQATGHCPHMSHPEETVRVIKAYLNQPKTPAPETPSGQPIHNTHL